MAVGLSWASFVKAASARRYESSASAGLPVCDKTPPMLLSLFATAMRKSVTVGLSSASFVKTASRLAVRIQCRGRLTGPRQQHAEVVVAHPQRATELGDGWIIVGQLARIGLAWRYGSETSPVRP